MGSKLTGRAAELGMLAERVERETEKHEAAAVAAAAAEREVLREIIDAVRPALSALSSVIYTKRAWHQRRKNEAPAVEKFEHAGVRIGGEGPKPFGDRYGGTASYLLEDGTPIVFGFRGTISDDRIGVEGVYELHQWTAMPLVRGDEYLEQHEETVETIADNLRDALTRQLAGKKEQRTAELEALAERLHAVAVLLRRA